MITCELEEHVLSRNGCNLHYWLTGPKSKPLLVFTHGAWINHHEFETQIPAFCEQYRILLWDVRGHGLSRPAKPFFTVKEAVQDLLALLDIQQTNQAILLGHSMGGNLIQEVVFYHPERVKALICLDCTCNTMKLNSLEAFAVKMVRPILGIYPYKILRRQAANITSVKSEVRQEIYDLFEGLPKSDYINIMMELTFCLHEEPNYRIEKPLLIIVGDQDRTGNIRKVAPIWAKRDAGSQLVIVPNAGHAVNMEQPDIVNRTILEFLNKIK